MHPAPTVSVDAGCVSLVGIADLIRSVFGVAAGGDSSDRGPPPALDHSRDRGWPDHPVPRLGPVPVLPFVAVVATFNVLPDLVKAVCVAGRVETLLNLGNSQVALGLVHVTPLPCAALQRS